LGSCADDVGGPPIEAEIGSEEKSSLPARASDRAAYGGRGGCESGPCPSAGAKIADRKSAPRDELQPPVCSLIRLSHRSLLLLRFLKQCACVDRNKRRPPELLQTALRCLGLRRIAKRCVLGAKRCGALRPRCGARPTWIHIGLPRHYHKLRTKI
jgi:hypothetical protein